MANEPKKLSDLEPGEGFIPSPLQPTRPTHMALGRDPATMEFEIRDATNEELAESETAGAAPSAEVEQVQQAAQSFDAEPADALEELIELDQSEDGLWLMMPIGEVCVVRIAKTLPLRTYQKMIHLMRDRRKFAQAGLNIEEMSPDDLDALLTMSEEILRLVVNPEDWPMIETGLESLTHPIGPAELGPVVSQIVPRYTRGTGGTKGK